MRGFLLGASFSVIFVAGLLVGVYGAPGLRDAHAAKPYSYVCDVGDVYFQGEFPLQEKLTKLGEEGYELVALAGGGGHQTTYCVRR